MLPFAADQTRCFEVFNASAVRPAPAAAPFKPDTTPYKQNAAATLAISTEFNARAQKRAQEFTQGFYAGSGLFDLGTTQYSCHVKDAPVLQSILDSMKADGLLSDVKEIPFKSSRIYQYSKATFTPH